MGLFAKAATLRDHEAPPPPEAEPVGESPPPAEVGSQSATARPPGRGGGLLRRSQSVARTHSAPAEPEVGPREPDHPAEPEATPAPPEEAPESPAAPSVAAIQVTETVQAAEAEAAAEPLPETPGAEPLPPEAPDLYEAEPVWEAISPEAGYGDAMVGAELEPAGAAEPLPEEAAPTEPVLEVPLAEESPVEESLAEEPFPPPALEAEGAAQATEELMSDEAVPESFAVEPEAEEPAPSFPEPEEAVAPIVEWDRPEEAAPVPEPETAATESAPTPAATQSIEDRLAATATEILNARAGLDAPGVVFTLLQRRLRLARAALLVPDAPRGVLSPWAASGFDKTTLRRLRFTDQDVASLGLKTLEGPELAALARLFSSRDAATIERLYVWPCACADRVVGLALAAEMDPQLAGEDAFWSFLPGILQATGQVLAERRERELDRIRAGLSVQVAAPHEQVVAEALRRADGAPGGALVVRLGLRAAIEIVAVQAPALDRFRLTEDIGTVLSRLTLGTADVTIAPSPEDLLLVLPGKKEADIELLLHALLGALRSPFPALAALKPEELELRTRRFPEDGTTPAELIAGLC